MIGNLLSKILAGSAVGYLTNDLAVKMLFRKYFGLGGIVIKTRKEFEENVSKLVESDVISHRALEKEARKAEFKAALDQAIAHLLQEALPKAVPSAHTFADLPAFKESSNGILDLGQAAFAETLESVAPELAQQVALKNLLSEAQIQQISQKLSQQIIKFAEQFAYDNPFFSVQNMLKQTLDRLAERKVSDILDREALQEVTQQGTQLLLALPHFLAFNYQSQIDEILAKAQDKLELAPLIKQLGEQLAEKKISELLNVNGESRLPEALNEQVRSVLLSEAGDDVLKILLKALVNLLKQEDATIFDLLSKDLQASFERFLQNHLPRILKQLIPWVRDRKHKLENLVDRTFRRNINLVGELLVDLFVGNVGEFAGVERRIVEEIDKQDPELLAKRASDYLINFLKKHTIADIIKAVSEDNLLAALLPLLKQNMAQAVQDFKLSGIGQALEKKVGDFLAAADIAKYLQELLEQGLQKELKDGFLLHERFGKFTQDYLLKQLDQLLESPLNQWLNEEKTPDYAKQLTGALLNLLKEQETAIAGFLAKQIQDFIGDKQLSDFMKPKDYQSLHQFLETQLRGFAERQVEQWEDEKIRPYAQKLGKLPQADQQLSDYLQNYLQQNMTSLVEGRIQQLVQDNIHRLSNEQLLEMVKKALGKELKPLSYFGAFLGSFTGAGLSTIPSAGLSLSSLVLPATAYGITGWATNWLAIKMIFRPYKGIKIPVIKRNLPFTPGVLAKNRGRFAQSMGRFLGDRLLNNEGLQESFAQGKPRLQRRFREWLQRDDYSVLRQGLHSADSDISVAISRSISQLISQELLKPEGSLSNYLGKIGDNNLSSIESKSIEASLQQEVGSGKLESILQKELSQWIKQQIESNPSLKDLLPESFRTQLSQQLEQAIPQQLHQINQWLEQEDLLERLEHLLTPKLQNILQQNLSEVLSFTRREQIKSEVFKFLRSQIESERLKNWIFDFIDKKLKNEISPDKRLKDIFDGALIRFLESNTQLILEGIIDNGIKWLQKNKHKLTEKIYDDIEEKNLAAIAFEGGIKRTVKDLIDQEIPHFFRQEFASLSPIVQNEVSRIGEAKLSEIKLEVDPDNLQKRVEHLLKNHRLQHKIKQVTDLIIEERIYKRSLSNLLNLEEEKVMRHLKNLLEPEVQLVKKHLSKILQDEDNKRQIAQPIAALLQEILEKMLYPVRLQTLAGNLQGLDYERFAEKLVQQISQGLNPSAASQMALPLLINQLKQSPLKELLSVEDLQKDVQSTLVKVWETEDFQLKFKQTLNEALEKVIGQIPDKLKAESKDYLIEVAGKAIFDSIEQQLPPLLQAVALKTIVVREIEHMHPSQLEKLFYAFAGKYFKYLIGYGFGFGIVFGLSIDLGLWQLLAWLFG